MFREGNQVSSYKAEWNNGLRPPDFTKKIT